MLVLEQLVFKGWRDCRSHGSSCVCGFLCVASRPATEEKPDM